MTQAELEKRQDRARNETLVIKKTEEGFRVYSPGNPARNHLVTADPDQPSCSCPDFVHHAQDPAWRCKHILAVESHLDFARSTGDQVDPVELEERRAIQEESRRSEDARVKAKNPSQMLLKRSVSPDGRIDSLSVEFSCPTHESPAQDVRRHARRLLELQSEIVNDFLGKGVNGTGEKRPTPTGASRAVPAKMLRIGGMETRWGRRLYINVQVNGDVLKYFGSKKALLEAIEAAGYPDLTERIEEGTLLDLPCRVTTKPSEDGRYINVDELFPTLRTPERKESR